MGEAVAVSSGFAEPHLVGTVIKISRRHVAVIERQATAISGQRE
jgi:hypothetical protein